LTNFFWFDQVAILVKAKLENLLQGQIWSVKMSGNHMKFEL
jgi:hypothetical protein